MRQRFLVVVVVRVMVVLVGRLGRRSMIVIAIAIAIAVHAVSTGLTVVRSTIFQRVAAAQIADAHPPLVVLCSRVRVGSGAVILRRRQLLKGVGVGEWEWEGSVDVGSAMAAVVVGCCWDGKGLIQTVNACIVIIVIVIVIVAAIRV